MPDCLTLPPAWKAAFARDAAEPPALADPLPERRLARMLAAWIGVGLFFLVVPGTLLGVWNLLSISSARDAGSVATAWIQAHGHAQLLGWVGTFILGISLYAAPKFRGARLRSLRVAWIMWALWTVSILLRWYSGVEAWRWNAVWPATAAAQFAVAALALWQLSGSGSAPLLRDLWNRWIFAGFLALAAAFAYQFRLVTQPLAAPVLPAAGNSHLLTLFVWGFFYPAVWGYASRFLPSFLGLRPAGRAAANVALALWAAGLAAGSPWLILASVCAACWSLRIFHPGKQAPKTLSVDRHYPWFSRSAFAWLVFSAALAAAGTAPGMIGASRHAFTVGFLAMLIFSIGPRMLPSFLNSRELWSTRLMGASMWLLALGCTLRVASEPLAYAGVMGFGWKLLPVSAVIELAAVLLFAVNLGATMTTRIPVWINRRQIKDSMNLYWYVRAYPGTRRVLIENGLRTLGGATRIPRSLTLREAAEADGADPARVLRAVSEYLESRLARTIRGKF